MNQLITVTSAEIAEKANTLNSLAVTPENAKKVEDIRTDANKYIKGIHDQIDLERDKFLEPFKKAEDAALEILRPLEEASKNLVARILEAKKIAFKEEVRKRFYELSALNPYGEVMDFDQVYDPSWYGKTKKMWEAALSTKIRDFNRREDLGSTAFFLENVQLGQIKAVERFLIENGIPFRKAEL